MVKAIIRDVSIQPNAIIASVEIQFSATYSHMASLHLTREDWLDYRQNVNPEGTFSEFIQWKLIALTDVLQETQKLAKNLKGKEFTW